MHFVLRIKLCTTSSVSEDGDMDSENQYGDPDHPITQCEITSNKTNIIDGYIIKVHTVHSAEIVKGFPTKYINATVEVSVQIETNKAFTTNVFFCFFFLCE